METITRRVIKRNGEEVVLLIALALCQKMQFGKGNQYGKR